MAVQAQSGRGVRERRIGRAGAIGAGLVAALLVWAVAKFGFDVDFGVEQPGRPAVEVGVDEIAIFTLATGLLGWALLAVLERFAAARAMAVWTVVGAVVLVISFAPLFQVEASGGAKAALALMHVVVGAALIAGFRRTAGRPAGEPGRV